MHKIYIDIGSSTVKVYGVAAKQKIKLLGTRSFHFKQDFDPSIGITQQNKNALFDYIKETTRKYPAAQTKVYATALFRKLEDSARQSMADDFFRATGLFFNVVAHDLEGHYLEQALSAEYDLGKSLLLINIGGGSTELVVRKGKSTIERYNLELGIGTILQEFPFLNEDFSRHRLNDVVESILKKLPAINYKVPHAIYNGGELSYMQLVGYDLQKNDLFKDEEHPYYIATKDLI